MGFSRKSLIFSIFILGLVQVTLCNNSISNLDYFAIGRFTHRLEQSIFKPNNPTNLIWSPVSVYTSLLSLIPLTSGTTLLQLRAQLGISEGQNVTSLDNLQDSSTRLATAIFIQKDLAHNLRNVSGLAEVHEFNTTDNLPSEVNQWISTATGGSIPRIIDNVGENTMAVLINAAMFNGTWRIKFNRRSTSWKYFKGLGSSRLVEMMQQRSVQNYGVFHVPDGKEFEVLKMGYEKSQMQIVFVLPQSPNDIFKVFDFLRSESGEKLRAVLERLEPTDLEIEVPKMEVKSRVELKQTLKDVGLDSLFSTTGSNISSLSLAVDDIIHEALLKLDEDGTKASAATAAVIEQLSNLEVKKFSVNRPFIVYLRWRGQLSFFEGIVTSLGQDVLQTNSALDHSPKPNYLTSSHETSTEKVEINLQNTTAKFQQPEPKDPEGIRFPNPKVNGTRLKYKFLGLFHGERIEPILTQD